MYIGSELAALVEAAGLACLSSRIAGVAVPAARMARLHALNIRTWQNDSFIRGSLASSEIAELTSALDRIASGEEEAAPVVVGMAQIVARA
jgi:hypothetical protein